MGRECPRHLPLKAAPGKVLHRKEEEQPPSVNPPCFSRLNDSQNATSAGTTPWLCPSKLDPRLADSLLSDRPFTLWQAWDCTRHGCEPGPGG